MLGKLAGPGKASAKVCGEVKFSQCPCWDIHENRYWNQWEHVSRKRESRRGGGREEVANIIDVVPYAEHRLETVCGVRPPVGL